MRFQGLDLEAYNLRPFYGDFFEWSMDCDEQARKGRFPDFNPMYFEIHFIVSDGKEQEATAPSWAKMGYIRPNGITMLRESSHDTVSGSQIMFLQDKPGINRAKSSGGVVKYSISWDLVGEKIPMLKMSRRDETKMLSCVRGISLDVCLKETQSSSKQ
ncbi:hypothetical protein BKA67DRAFT_535050 [Truncatella angustata]|uniref:Uncharacterized protein n=1 Tax=Truncatella angustata TaxID=152316 RepID=A0A9P8UQB0_9PEZI|nr:uncharacterized protein BKA67DRAFT_535050 [Truncatella angustata]KAH6656156.1 hypothetical protein BKA67DRAFT_535050 [Truncatella angustata]